MRPPTRSCVVGGVHLIGKDGRPLRPRPADVRRQLGARAARPRTFGLAEGAGPWGRGELALDRNTARRAGLRGRRPGPVVTATGTVEGPAGRPDRRPPPAGPPRVAAGRVRPRDRTAGAARRVRLDVGRDARPATAWTPTELRERVQAAGGDAGRGTDRGRGGRRGRGRGRRARSARAGSVLGLFAGLALFVGGFLIFNTFAVLVTQRVRELGLLRAVGASRAQVTRSVLAEALVIGAAGSTAGLLHRRPPGRGAAGGASARPASTCRAAGSRSARHGDLVLPARGRHHRGLGVPAGTPGRRARAGRGAARRRQRGPAVAVARLAVGGTALAAAFGGYFTGG